MILIRKKSEPLSLRNYRGKAQSSFDNMDADVKVELRNSLLEEQGYLCAYCMKRIRKANKVKIEHYRARTSDNELVYANLLAVCDGNETLRDEKGKVNPKMFTCDTMKRDAVLHINPQNISDMEKISYDNQGKIYSADSECQKDLDSILNLNNSNGYLISNRKAALKGILKKLSELHQGQDPLPLLLSLKRYCDNPNLEGEYPEYVGIMRWYIDKKLKRFNASRLDNET